MHVLLLVSLLSLVVLPGCWNPFSKNDSTENCGCSSAPTSCQQSDASQDSADENDPMLASARITETPLAAQAQEDMDTIKQ